MIPASQSSQIAAHLAARHAPQQQPLAGPQPLGGQQAPDPRLQPPIGPTSDMVFNPVAAAQSGLPPNCSQPLGMPSPLPNLFSQGPVQIPANSSNPLGMPLPQQGPPAGAPQEQGLAQPSPAMIQAFLASHHHH